MHIFCSFLHWTSQNITAEPQNDRKNPKMTPRPNRPQKSGQHHTKMIAKGSNKWSERGAHTSLGCTESPEFWIYISIFSTACSLHCLNFALLANIRYLYYAILDLYYVCTYTCAIPKLSQPPPLPPLCSFSVYSECSAVSMLSIC